MKAPQMQQVEQPSVKVFVEVHNPTKRDLNLERLRYRLVAKAWFDTSGEVRVRRTVTAGASAVVEILVPVSDLAGQERMRGVPYTLDARLYAVTDKTERSWSLSAKGALASSGGARVQPIQVADRY
ncbi:MAG: hypothetical protein GY811_16475 [Myxococcales bacterium]|nr:hypothetical protein [Myxococcales bacterium]